MANYHGTSSRDFLVTTENQTVGKLANMNNYKKYAYVFQKLGRSQNLPNLSSP